MNIKYLKISVLLISLFAVTSCKKFLDVNDDPNNPTAVLPEVVLPAAQASIGGSAGGDFAIIGGIWSQHWAQSHVSSQYKTIDAYDLAPGDYDVSWNELYAGGLNDCEVIKTQAEARGDWNLYLQATCMQAYGFQMLADFFDKIPYTEALQGSKNLSPKFDDGSVVYAGLLADLDAALAKDFSGNAVSYVAQDLVFPLGNRADQIAAWKKFANTLKLKMYMRQTASSQWPAAKSAIQAMIASGTQFLDTDAAITQFVDQPDRSNFLYENNVRQLNTGGNLRLSATLETFLESNGDEGRLAAYFSPAVTGGTYFGLQQGNYEALTSVICATCVSNALMTPTDKFYFMSYDESLFLQAEAALWLDNAAAATLYEEAVNAAYAKFGISAPAGILAAGGKYAYPATGTTADKHKAIMTQKWVAMYKQGYESFFDQARTGYPKTSAVPGTAATYVPGEWTYSTNGVTGAGNFPKRLLFPSASSDVNSNTPTRLPVTTKVWWMQ